MLSPMPIRPELGGPLSSPGQLLASPGWPLTSPRLGRTPGAYVVQEGRLSLEMFHLGDAEDGQRGARSSLDLAATLDEGAAAAAAGLQKGPSSHDALYVLQHRHQLKAVTPALVGATEEQLAAKAAHAAKLLQELPGALQGEMRRAVADAKGALGMPGYDASRIEAQLRSVLQAENGAAPSSAPGGAPPAAHPARPGRDDAGEGGGAQAAAARGAKRAHAATRPDAAHEVHPKRRIDLIKELEAQLAHIYHRTRALEQAAAQAEARRAEAAQENESLWALTTHIHTAIAVALAERRAQAAAAPRAVPAPPPPAPPPPPPATQQRQPEAGGQVPQSGGLPRMTPGNGLAALFSPDGDDLFAACNMFISPADRALAAQPGDKPRKLFGEETAGPGEPPAPPAGAL